MKDGGGKGWCSPALDAGLGEAKTGWNLESQLVRALPGQHHLPRARSEESELRAAGDGAATSTVPQGWRVYPKA